MVRRGTVLRELNQLEEAKKNAPNPDHFRLPAAKAAAWHERAALADQTHDHEAAFEAWSKAGALESELPEWRRLDRTLWPRQVQAWTEWCKNTEQSVGSEARNPDESSPLPPHYWSDFQEPEPRCWNACSPDTLQSPPVAKPTW
jgi:hypothetical protein